VKFWGSIINMDLYKDKMQQNTFAYVYYRNLKPSVPLIQHPRLPKQEEIQYFVDKVFSTSS